MKVILIIVTLCYLIYLSKYNNCKKSKQMQFPEYIKKDYIKVLELLPKIVHIVEKNCQISRLIKLNARIAKISYIIYKKQKHLIILVFS